MTVWSAAQLKELLEQQIEALRGEVADLKAQREADRKTAAVEYARLSRLVYMGVGIAAVAVTVLELVVKR